ncbi:MAG: UDP-N-acetylglucosamine 2-epimerase (hydrolyzing) [Lachnospiraceae bacterium]|nr:UDP-N-acetylglucosamine 2-epimerase (hydrolyzing) [Lachnospiraceae bacterium]
MKKILFITGTRADYGKMKSLIKAVNAHTDFELYIYVSGMHLLERLGSTYMEVLKDGYTNVFVDFSQANTGDMSYDLGDVICHLTNYVHSINPDMIIVHGDRIDALAGAIVGAFANIKVVHIEGGELSGTIDESIRHAISKFAHIHMVCTQEAKGRLIQLGENSSYIYILGSPDIDIMLSDNLPDLESTKKRYTVDFDKYAIFMYHPVTTELEYLSVHIKSIVDALIDTGLNYIIVYPNNDHGSDIILHEYERLDSNPHFRIFPSIRFEHFLTFMKNADFFIGNSSAGIRETGVYGIPAIDIGSRQKGRFDDSLCNIQHVTENKKEIISAVNSIEKYRVKIEMYGDGNSTKRFIDILEDDSVWNSPIQKRFIDINRSTL